MACVSGGYCGGDDTCKGCTQDEGEPAACSTNDSPTCGAGWKSVATEKDQWLILNEGSPFPSVDVDFFVVTLTDTEFLAFLDPTVEFTNESGVPLEVCVWWKNASGEAATLTNGCTDGDAAGSYDLGWEGAPGCCRIAASMTGVQKVGFAVTDAPGQALVRVRPSAGLGSCGKYTMQVHL